MAGHEDDGYDSIATWPVLIDTLSRDHGTC